MLRLHALALIMLFLCVPMGTTLIHAKPSSNLILIHAQTTNYPYAHALCHCTHGLHRILAPCPWLHALEKVNTTPCSCLKPTLLPIDAMAPCHIPFFLGIATSHGIVPMTPYSYTRHCTPCVQHPILCLESTSLLSMTHPSNKPWHWAHGSSSHPTQGITPLYCCWEESSHHSLCHYRHKLHTTTCHRAHVWVRTRLTPCALLMSKALHQGLQVWPCPSHHASP